MTKLVVVLGSILILGALSCQEKMKEVIADDPNLTSLEDSLFERGEFITATTFDSLRTHVLRAMASDGPQGAVSYCNMNAASITSVLQTTYNVTIRRATDRARNQENKANEWETSIIKAYAEDLHSDTPPRSRLFKEGSTYHFVKPIFTLPLCLQCHGKVGESMNSEQAQFINSLYPDDHAIGYGDKELRGIWHITF